LTDDGWQKAETATGGGREWRRQYNSNGLRGPAAVATREGTSLCIPPALARGLWLEFRQARPLR